AAPTGLAVTISAKGQADLPPELAGITTRSAFYDVQPAGTTLSQPATFYRDVSLATLGIDPLISGFPLISLADRTGPGNWVWLANGQELIDATDPTKLNLSGDVGTFGDMLRF